MGYRRVKKIDRTNPPDLEGLRYQTPVAELDLHGQTVQQAMTALRRFVMTQGRSHPGKVVRVITGRGSHSPVGPRLGPALENELLGLSSFVAESARSEDGGSYLIRLR